MQPILSGWSERIAEHEDRLFLLLTILIGAIVGLAVVAFILLTEHVGALIYPAGGAAWRRLLAPTVGALLMGFLLARYFPQARGSGVPQTKAALFAHGGRITLRTLLGKFFCTSATLASGIPLGREGPSVQVGAGIASVLGRRLGLSEEKVKSLIPVASAAAIAAAFNTPLAGVLFSLEEVMGDLHAPVLGSVVLSSATSWIVLRMLLGNDPLFRVPQYQLVHPLEFGLYAVLGVAGGFVSVAFVKLLLGMRRWFLRLPKSTEWLQPLAGGVLVGAMAWFVPQVLGVGYRYVGDALQGNLALQLMVLLVVLKLLAVTVSYASGNAGGIFGPSLFIGAMLGGALGSIAHRLLPAYTATPGAYALVGMGALFAGIVRAPMTSVVMIFETTRDYTIIVPLMIANLTSFYISRRLQREPIYEALAQQDGVHLPSGKTRSRLRVSLAMRPGAEAIPAEMSPGAALGKIREFGCRSWPVADARGVRGVISVAQLEDSRADARTVGELLEEGALQHVHSDQPLDLALERMGATGVDVLPVVSRADGRQLQGVIVLGDALAAYGLHDNPPREGA
ncbi:MAG TPA: chloride channel protein [Candidatus Acidoferrales bacterium]|nr:chloride channel protein [Candidatus Acidoferrales bacterium]